MQKSAKKPDSSTYNLIENERNYRHHVTRLVQISTSKKPTTTKQKSMVEHDQLLKRGQDSLRRRQTQRLLDIQKDNDRILGNLLRITQRPDKNPPLTAQAKGMRPVQPKVSSSTKSLNQATRKNEIMKILNENVKITGRLIFQDSKMSKDKMALDFKKHQQYSERIRKVRMNSDKTFTIGHGGVKMTRDMRVASHTSYLPPLKPGFLTQRDPGMSYRSYSAPKLQLSQLLKTDRGQRSPTRDVNQKEAQTQRSTVAKTEDVPQSTFISQLDIRSNSIPAIQLHNSQLDGSVTEREIQGYQTERYEVSPERAHEEGPYTQRTYITSYPMEREVQEEQKEGNFVREVSPTYEESQREVPGLKIETKEEPDGEPSEQERQRTESNVNGQSSQERKETERGDSKEKKRGEANEEDSEVEIQEDNEIVDYDEEDL